MQGIGSCPRLHVSADGSGVVGHAGARLLADLADATGLTSAYSTALAALDRRNPPPSVIAGRMNRVMAFLARRLATRRQIIRAIGRLTAEGA